METEITARQMRKLDYRRNRLEGRLRRLEGLLSGRDHSLLPLVRDGEGRFSETGTWTLVEQLLEDLRTCRRFRAAGEGLDGTLAQEDEALYKSFLYCAVRYAECPPGWDAGWFDQRPLFEAGGTYEDLVTLARALSPVEKTWLHYCEFYEPYSMQGFFGCMDGLYEHLTSSSIQKTVSEADRLAMREAYRSEIAGWEAFAAVEPPDWDEGLWQNDTDTLTPEEIAAGEEETWQWEEDSARNERALADWLEAFAEKESFCRQYLLLREAYFDAPARRTLSQDVEHMLETALLRQGLSSYLDDEVFFGALTLLDQAAGAVKRRLSGGR